MEITQLQESLEAAFRGHAQKFDIERTDYWYVRAGCVQFSHSSWVK